MHLTEVYDSGYADGKRNRYQPPANPYYLGFYMKFYVEGQIVRYINDYESIVWN